MTGRDGDRRHAPGSEARARRRQSQRRAGVRGFRSSLTQQCEEGDPEGGKHEAHFYRLRPQRREVRPDTSALLDGENLALMVAHQDDIAGGSADWSPRPRAGAPGSAWNARRLHFRSQFRVSMLSPLQRRRISARIVEPGPAPTLIAWWFGSAIQEVFDRFGGRESELL
jgi:hypothetical protein